MSIYARPIAILAILTAIAGATWYVYSKGVKSGKAEIQAQWDKATAIANESARELERMNRLSKEKALENRTKEIMVNVAAADRARVASERLLDTSERSLQAARENHAACVVSAATHAELLGYCEREYRSMAGKAQGHASDAKALIEAWPK